MAYVRGRAELRNLNHQDSACEVHGLCECVDLTVEIMRVGRSNQMGYFIYTVA